MADCECEARALAKFTVEERVVLAHLREQRTSAEIARLTGLPLDRVRTLIRSTLQSSKSRCRTETTEEKDAPHRDADS